MQKQQTKFEQLQAQLEATMQDKVCLHACRHCDLCLCGGVGVGVWMCGCLWMCGCGGVHVDVWVWECACGCVGVGVCPHAL